MLLIPKIWPSGLVEKGFLPMQMLIFCYPVLAVSTIYCLWERYERARLLRVWTTFANQIPQTVMPCAHLGGGRGPRAWRTTRYL
jgi:hypothetical protein